MISKYCLKLYVSDSMAHLVGRVETLSLSETNIYELKICFQI